jgi:arylsulfatase A-like enzyme
MDSISMNRREFIGSSVAASVASGIQPANAATTTKARRKPNVLYVFSDEHRSSSLPGEPFNGAIAPTIASFAADNLAFRNCISNYPVCSPYRGILMTGKWPYQSGIIDNAIQLPDDAGSIGKTFQDAGYLTSYIGKWHLAQNDNVFIPKGPGRQGFADWHVWARTNPHFNQSFTFDPDTGAKIQPQGYNCTLMTDMAVKFLAERKAERQAGNGANAETKPWFLILSWNPPHPPFGDAPPDEMKRYDPATMKLRPNVKLVPEHSKTLESEQKLRHAQQGYYAHISAVDAEFARVLKALDETGEADNTIVVYTSDHGEMMGSHGYMDKRLPFEESCKVPFFLRYPGVTPKGSESEILFSAADIYPTLCGLAGVPVPEHCVGHDLSAAMHGKKVSAPESVFLMHISKARASGGDENVAPLFRGVRTSTHTYAVADDGRWFLYNNQEDPFQQHNLINDPTQAELIKELDAVVLDWLKKAQDPFPYASVVTRMSVHST